MFGHLPDHLSQLNSISSPPTTGITADTEEAFWQFMNTDELFESFAASAHSPASPKSERKPSTAAVVAAPQPGEQQQQPAEASPAVQEPPAVASGSATPATGSTAAATPAATLESFLAAFANEPPATAAAHYRMPLPLPLPYNALASSSGAQAGLSHIDTSAIQPFQPAAPYTAASTPADEKPTGAKRLKAIGAGPEMIEEDKRRRNTEASARFRAKKKEREQALEGRAKQLEAQVAQLIAEKASLENENKLLKAIVLGGQAPAGSSEAVSSAIAQLGDKRRRD